MTRPRSSRPQDAAGIVGGYVREQCDAVMAAEVMLVEGIDQVHDTRVAIRRLRSTLRSFSSLFETTQAAELDVELAWFAGLLGALRDREVQQERLASALSELPPDLVLGPVREQIEGQLGTEQRFHHEELVAAMAGDRYRMLLASLVSWAGGPPYLTRPDDPADLVRLARKAGRTADKRLEAALATGAGSEDESAALHRARKAAKRARYSAELVRPVGGKGTKQRIAHSRSVQQALGAHHDSVLAAELLRRLGAGAGTTPGHNGFTYGLLYAHEVVSAQRARDEAVTLSTGRTRRSGRRR